MRPLNNESQAVTRMSKKMTRISKGYVRIENSRYYAELYVRTPSMDYQIRIFHKGHTVSWKSCKHRESWRFDGAFIYMWFTIDGIPFSCRNLNDHIDGLITLTGLKIYEESRKWLTQKEKEVAHMLATESIGILDAEELLGTDVEDMPQVFHEEVSKFRDGYYAYLKRREREDREMAAKLNTPEGLAYMLRIANRYGEHQPAVSFIKALIFDLTELWDK